MLRQSDTAVQEPARTNETLTLGSAHAKALLSISSGTILTLVDSPPGAGKSTLIIDLAHTLVSRHDLLPNPAPLLVIATPTRRAAADLYVRLLTRLTRAGLTPFDVDASTTVSDGEVDASADGARGALDIIGSWAEQAFDAMQTALGEIARVKVTTVDSWAMTSAAGQTAPDLLIFDEAYQTTFAKAWSAARTATQLLMVGDPGQIGPVVNSRFGTSARAAASPSARAPEGFASVRDIDVQRLSLPHTHRLGPESADIVSAFYSFDFDSARADTAVTDGRRVFSPITTLDGAGEFRSLCAQAVDKVRPWLGRTLQVEGQDSRSLTVEDIAVVVAQNDLRSYIHALARGAGLDGLTVGTADSLQGGQWPVVIAVDPLLGKERLSGHHLDPGRLCVMLSRHSAHLTWIRRPDWKTAVESADYSARMRRTMIRVRDMLDEHRSRA